MAANPENLISKIRTYKPDADMDHVRLAFDYAKNAHGDQKRKSGEPYIIHPLATAEILADMELPVPILIAGLLHDVPEDTDVTIEDIRKDFGDDIASMVAGITKLGKIKYRGIDRYVENLRKMFVAMASDIRVILIKFADRIHNLSTLSALPPNKRKRVALESLEIYAPIANRLGVNEMRAKLEDLSFEHAMPKEHEWVSKLMAKALRIKKSYVDRVRTAVEKELAKASIEYIDIHGRVKHKYSMYRKLIKYDRDIVQVQDLVALRIIVPRVSDCYAVLGVIHQNWRPLKGRIKDYISQPKPNGYQSLHTTVFCEDGEMVEFQIRTPEMHEESERGIAAHWQYDEDGKIASPQIRGQMKWVKELADQQKNIVSNVPEYLESLEKLKIDVFQNRIFVFTPDGDVIDLPEAATPVDFAYNIHSQIGNTCVGARVNDHIVSLDTVLYSGDCCEIIVDKNRKGPNPDWLSFVKTSTARYHIRSFAKAKLTRWIKNIKYDPEGDKAQIVRESTKKPR
ncbi:MAG: RelA/SpoT family protein [Patescibacteria group bacterium]|nr:RelA/SpoT family protein [Patescibacteria group bacterium]